MAPKHNRPPTRAPTPLSAFAPVDKAEFGAGQAVVVTVAAAPAADVEVKIEAKFGDSSIVGNVERAKDSKPTGTHVTCSMVKNSPSSTAEQCAFGRVAGKNSGGWRKIEKLKEEKAIPSFYVLSGLVKPGNGAESLSESVTARRNLINR